VQNSSWQYGRMGQSRGLTVGQPSASLLRWVLTCRLTITNNVIAVPDWVRIADPALGSNPMLPETRYLTLTDEFGLLLMFWRQKRITVRSLLDV
jgi:hypothetical protein